MRRGVSMARVLVLLPARDFDPSEAAVSWRVLVNAGHAVSFATPDGQSATADEMMLTGQGLDPWGGVPLLRNLPLIGLLMRANGEGRKAYAEMIADPNYLAPKRWDAVEASTYDGLLLPGGHRARGMREYLESIVLQMLSSAFSRKKSRWRRSAMACCWRHGVSRSEPDARHFGDIRPPLSPGRSKTARGRSPASRGSGIPTITALTWSSSVNPRVSCRCSTK